MPTGIPHGLMFHRLHADGAPPAGQGSLGAADFERVLRQAGLENILPPAEWRRRLREGRLEPQHRCVTFDDGLRCQWTVARPILDRLGLKAFWFVYSCVQAGVPVKSEIYSHVAVTRFPSMDAFMEAFLAACSAGERARLREPAYAAYAARTRAMCPFYSELDLQFRYVRNDVLSPAAFEQRLDAMLAAHGVDVAAAGRDLWLTDSQLVALAADGHEVGLHSYDHPFDLARLTPDEQRRQYACNRAHLDQLGLGPVMSMSHPLNSYSSVTLAILAEMGIACGFRSNLMPPAGRAVNPGPLELARQDPANLLRADQGAA